MKGKEACPTNFGEIKYVMDTLAPFFGVILIIFGLAMLLYGKRIYSRIISVTLFLFSAAMIFGMLYNFFLTNESEPYIIYVFIAIAVVGGLLVGYLTFKFARKSLPMIITCIGGVAVGLEICAVAGVEVFEL